MVKHRRSRRGQSILEYLVIATVIVGAILLVRGTVQTNMNSLYNAAANHTAAAATSLATLPVEGNSGGPGPGPGPGGPGPGPGGPGPGPTGF